ncbi:MAG: 50S ribosomal protein L34e [Candidatus Aenigmarchaeota archaeon]|nr:50S ribosomal protein L34e [Candidatus Aenigmarchaeota archaeon]
MKRIKNKSPAGKIRIYQIDEKPARVICANCKMPLQGIKKSTKSEFKKLSASEKGPERPYGGYLCSGCSREIFKEKIRSV